MNITKEYSLKSQKIQRVFVSRNLNTLKAFFLLAITIWIAYFWHSASFGLYADDFWRVGEVMGITWSEFSPLFLEAFLRLDQTVGHPLHDIFLYLLPFIGLRLGGLHVVYWIGYAILTVNSLLFYTLLKRLSNQPIFVVTGALSFCLFSAHTTQLWMTMTLGAQPSLMLLLLAIHCYLSGKRNLSYLLILGSLLCYEIFFPVFLAVPLLKMKWDSRIIRELFRHALVLGSMLVCVVIIRQLTGERRVANLELLDAIKTSIRHMLYIGPIASMKTFLTRPLITLRALMGKDRLEELWLFLPLYFAGLVWVLSRLKLSLPRDVFRLKTAFDSKVLRLEAAEFFDNQAKLALIGLIMLVLAYPLTLNGSPWVVNGLGSRVHLAGCVGASILIGCICSVVLFLAATYGRKRLATLCLAAFFSLLVGFGLIVQQDYKLAWQYERAYWSDVIKLIPDLDSETVVLFDPTGLRKPIYVDSPGVLHQNSVLSRLYQLPEDWKKRSSLSSNFYHLVPLWVNGYLMRSNWRENIEIKGNSFQLNKSVAAGYYAQEKPTVESSKVILLEAKDGQLTRRTEPLIIRGQKVRLKEKSASGHLSFKKEPLYDYLIKSPDEEPVKYIK